MQDADDGDPTTMVETLRTAAEQVEAVLPAAGGHTLMHEHAHERRGEALAHRPAFERRVHGDAVAIALPDDTPFPGHDECGGHPLGRLERGIRKLRIAE